MPTDTPVPADTDTPMPTDTPVPADTDTPMPTDTLVPTSTAIATATLMPTSTETATPAPSPTLVVREGDAAGNPSVRLEVSTEETVVAPGSPVQFIMGFANDSDALLTDVVIKFIVPEDTEFINEGSGYIVPPAMSLASALEPLDLVWQLADGSGPAPARVSAGTELMLRIGDLPVGISGALAVNLELQPNIEIGSNISLAGQIEADNLAGGIAFRLNDSAGVTTEAPTSLNPAGEPNGGKQIYLPLISN